VIRWIRGNPLCFLTGPLTGTPFPTSGRFTVATRSPLTGLWLDSHSGGHFAHTLRRTGFDGIVFTGHADVPVYLWIDEGKVELREAKTLWGLGVEETVGRLRDETDPKAHVASIGPAGENLVRFASIAIDRDSDPWRAGMAGRGGAGAVMGSKNLKAVAVKGTKPVPLADEAAMKVLVKDLLERVMKSPGVHSLRVLGTAALVEPMNRTGILPCFNFGRGYLDDAHALNGANLRYHARRDAGCFNCPIVCGRVMPVDGRDVKVEYEALALLGASCGVTDVVDVARAIAVCNDMGMDVISAGGVVAFAMDASAQGLLDGAPGNGGALPSFGDAAGQVALLEKIARRKGIGNPPCGRIQEGCRGHWRGSPRAGDPRKGHGTPGVRPALELGHGPGLCHVGPGRVPPAGLDGHARDRRGRRALFRGRDGPDREGPAG
jgi:Aldehyde:ferredoxin oxidoreductase